MFEPAMKRLYDENGYLVVENALTSQDLVGVRRRTG